MISGTDTDEIEQFVAMLESALNAHNADEYNRYFADDISWGNPNGGLLRGLEALHAVHKSFLEGPLRNSKFNYTVERAERLGSDVAYAHVRLTRTASDGAVVESDERCLYVFVRREGTWWLCAGHNTRVQPGQNAE
jgi:uncharacterized protein (TIGR02246 family)